MLKVLLPTTLPTAMSRSPRSVATIDVATSGSEVPAATIVRPMTRSETPSARANPVAASTSQSAPRISSASPATTSSTWTDQCRSQREAGARIHERRLVGLPCRRGATAATRKTV